ncbi:hypothetical protein B0H10DRAFT_1953302 [Mycena sp. CBHHK59/15]|nr:hypothetical protein B0H10DRAFT_1953302 [Mycena sp. CBHHK59/15]
MPPRRQVVRLPVRRLRLTLSVAATPPASPPATPRLKEVPRAGRSAPDFDPAKHPNCRVTELFAQGGFPRVTLEEIDRIFDAAGHPRGPQRAALVEAFLRDADAALDASSGHIRCLGDKRGIFRAVIKVGLVENLERCTQQYGRCGGETFQWLYFYGTSTIKLIERLVHLALQLHGGLKLRRFSASAVIGTVNTFGRKLRAALKG